MFFIILSMSCNPSLQEMDKVDTKHDETSMIYSPAQHTQHKIEDKKRSEDDQAYKVHPGQFEPDRIVHLHE